MDPFQNILFSKLWVIVENIEGQNLQEGPINSPNPPKKPIANATSAKLSESPKDLPDDDETNNEDEESPKLPTEDLPDQPTDSNDETTITKPNIGIANILINDNVKVRGTLTNLKNINVGVQTRKRKRENVEEGTHWRRNCFYPNINFTVSWFVKKPTLPEQNESDEWVRWNYILFFFYF